jgi:peptidyl-tRNA hydrolase
MNKTACEVGGPGKHTHIRKEQIQAGPQQRSQLRTRNQVSRETLEEIRQHTFDVIGSFVSLKPAGGSFKGLCPFHEDQNPSLSVRGAFFRCFACGHAGDVFKFVMLSQDVAFPKAVRIAAQIAGVSLRGESPQIQIARNRDAGLRRALDRWREETQRAVADRLREKDELLLVARTAFDGGTINEDLFWDCCAVAFDGYSLLEWRYEQLVRDDLYPTLDLWREARKEPV